MKVRVLGPNLAIQDSVTFHCHAEGCADLKKRHYAGAESDVIDVDDRVEVATFCYDPDSFDFDPDNDGELAPYIDDVQFFACCDALPRRAQVAS